MSEDTMYHIMHRKMVEDNVNEVVGLRGVFLIHFVRSTMDVVKFYIPTFRKIPS
jgi:hypothetical protein